MNLKLQYLLLLISMTLVAQVIEYEEEYCPDQTELSEKGYTTLADFTDKFSSDWNNPKEEDFWGVNRTDYEADWQFDTDFFY